MRLLSGCLAALAVAGLLAWQGRGESLAAEVEGLPVTRMELREALRAHLWRRGESWAALEEAARHQVRQTVLDILVNDRLIRFWRLREGPAVPEAETRRESALLQRQFVGPADYARRLAGQHHTQNTLDHTIRQAQLDEAWLAAQMPAVDAREAHAWYEQHPETLRIPQAHHAFHIFLTRHAASEPGREAEIRQIHRQLIAKEKTFAVLARLHSEDGRTKLLGGDLGWFTRERMPADFVSAVEKLRVGEISQPVLTALGWHIIWVLERRPSRRATFTEAQPEIHSFLTSQRQAYALETLLADLRRRSSPHIFYHQAVVEQTVPGP